MIIGIVVAALSVIAISAPACAQTLELPSGGVDWANVQSQLQDLWYTIAPAWIMLTGLVSLLNIYGSLKRRR